MKFVIHPAVDSRRYASLGEAAPGDVVINAADETAAEREMAEADALFGRITPRLLGAAKKLRWVQTATASLEHYLFPELVEHPCVLTNMRGIFSDVIAEHVFGCLLCLTRNLHRYLRQQDERRWFPIGSDIEPPAPVWAGSGVTTAIDRAHRDLADMTLGVIGFGGIGREVARLGRAFQMNVVAIDRVPAAATIDGVECRPVGELNWLLESSDVVVICAPHTPQTEKMFRREQFLRMKRDAYLVNIGRGAIVDLADLTAALVDGRLAGAVLDVFETEPLPAEHPLWGLPNVILTPHVAARSPRVAPRHWQVWLDNLARFRAGKPLENVVDKRQWC